MIYLKKYTNSITQKFFETKSNIYLYYIRQCIYKANTADDLTNIFKNIASNYKNITTDELFSILTDCFIKYPLTENELQKISTWEQLYNTECGMSNYVTTTIWLCTIQAIQDNENNRCKKNIKLITYRENPDTERNENPDTERNENSDTKDKLNYISKILHVWNNTTFYLYSKPV